MGEEKTMRYCGGSIISGDSFLRQLPVCVDEVTRIQFDAIVIASDVISQAYGSVRSLLVQSGDSEECNEIERAIIIGNIWTIIDQLHAIRYLIQIRSSDPIGPETLEFLELSRGASSLRNKMDHLRANIGNLSNKKGSRMPIFGVVSYIYSTDPTLRNLTSVAVMAGSLHGDDSFPMINPANRAFCPPVDHFHLSAFGETFEVEPSLTAFRFFAVK